jgi:hypothetical protein
MEVDRNHGVYEIEFINGTFITRSPLLFSTLHEAIDYARSVIYNTTAVYTGYRIYYIQEELKKCIFEEGK